MRNGISLQDRAISASDLLTEQQPDWPNPSQVAGIRAELATRAAVVHWPEVRQLKELLAQAAAGEVCVLQAGDCAEDPAESDVPAVAPKIEMLDVLADIMQVGSGCPVVKVGRIAGQYAKPRSQNHEMYRGVRLAAFRGLIVNGIEPSPQARQPDPRRILTAHSAAIQACSSIETLGRGTSADPLHRIWTSHEALLLDYEMPMVRTVSKTHTYLASTHWPWIGERTRDPRSAHVQLLSAVDNPVACKLSSAASEEDVLQLCARLDPRREPGRLTLIARFGAARIRLLAPLVRAVHRSGHPVLWLCDPMHGNTIKGPNGLKVRRLADIMNEIRQFVRIVTTYGDACAGLHLEASPGDIRECDGAGFVATRGPSYQTLCDPRLNLTQAVATAAHWQPRIAHELRTETTDWRQP